MDTEKTGKISHEADGYRVEFVRHYALDAMTVWDAITNPEKLALWFMKVELDLKPGARMTIHYGDQQNSKGYGKITAVVPGKLFEYLWENEEGPDELSRWEIFSEGSSACRLVLTHTRIDESYASRVPAGWHIMLDHLQEILNGRTDPFFPGSENAGDIEIKDFYKNLIKKQFPKTL